MVRVTLEFARRFLIASTLTYIAIGLVWFLYYELLEKDLTVTEWFQLYWTGGFVEQDGVLQQWSKLFPEKTRWTHSDFVSNLNTVAVVASVLLAAYKNLHVLAWLNVGLLFSQLNRIHSMLVIPANVEEDLSKDVGMAFKIKQAKLLANFLTALIAVGLILAFVATRANSGRTRRSSKTTGRSSSRARKR